MAPKFLCKLALEAKDRGENTYFTGKPCKHGHVAPRYLVGTCSVCAANHATAYKKRDPEKVAAQRKARYYRNVEDSRRKAREWNKANWPKIKAKRRAQYTPTAGRKKRGLPEPTRPMPPACELCSREFDTTRKRPMRSPHLDHCHDTGVFRGWLCGGCNNSIGHLGDNAAGLRRALAYLEKFEATHVE